MKKYIIFGTSAYLSDIFDLIHSQNGIIKKIFQNVPETIRERELTIKQRISLLEYKVDLYDSLETFEPEKNCEYVLGFPSVQKYKLINELKEKYGIKFSSLIHPQSFLGSNVNIGEGVTIAPHVVVAPNTHLDDFCVINRAAAIGHDVRVGKYSNIGPSVVVAGSCKIGKSCFIGMNASILPTVYVGSWTFIGAGSVVTKDIPEGVIAYGLPAKIVRKNERKPT